MTAIAGIASAHQPRHPLPARSWRGLVMGLLASATLFSCAVDPASNDVSAVQFQDVVVPTGMRLRDGAHESHSREEHAYRFAHFEYVGSTDLQAAADYVRERMPQHSWTKLQDEDKAEAGLRMLFERGIYRADYTFSRSEGSTVMVVDYTTDFSRR